MIKTTLSDILDKAWETLPHARRLLSNFETGSFSPSQFIELGQRLFAVGSGFERLGQSIPARLSSGMGEAFTELGYQNLVPVPPLIELLQTAMNRWADLLVELDATGELNAPEPTDTLIRLQASSPKRFQSMASDCSSSLQEAETRQQEIERYSEALVAATSSLLDRIHKDDNSPYAASVSRISHLAESLRDHLLDSGFRESALGTNSVRTRDSFEQKTGTNRFLPASTTCSPISLPSLNRADETVGPAEIVKLETERRACVYLVDESPFFRMLLTSAIITAGFSIETAGTFDALKGSLENASSDDVIVYGITSSNLCCQQFSKFLGETTSSNRPVIFALVDQESEGAEISSQSGRIFEQAFVRANFTELRAAILERLRRVAQNDNSAGHLKSA